MPGRSNSITPARGTGINLAKSEAFGKKYIAPAIDAGMWLEFGWSKPVLAATMYGLGPGGGEKKLRSMAKDAGTWVGKHDKKIQEVKKNARTPGLKQMGRGMVEAAGGVAVQSIAIGEAERLSYGSLKARQFAMAAIDKGGPADMLQADVHIDSARKLLDKGEAVGKLGNVVGGAMLASGAVRVIAGSVQAFRASRAAARAQASSDRY